MKRFLLFATFICTAILSSCEKYDDSQIWDKLNDHEQRIIKLEELCAQMNTNINSLQTIVNALQQKDFITTITPINKDGKEVGYTINFTSGNSITIYHGADGKDGQNGSDGHTPIIGVKQASDGIFYWTIDGEWLLDNNGNQIKATGSDGNDGSTGPQGPQGDNGQNGKDGITPQLKIEDDYWYVSYDDGKTWTNLGKATSEGSGNVGGGSVGPQGPQGPQGEKGDSFFQSVTQDADNVYFVLADGTTITIPKSVKMEDIELTYIPRYSDGKATVFYLEKEDSYLAIDFEVSPASAIDDWHEIATVKAIYTETRANVEFVDMEILEWATDTTNGTITVKASGKNLSDEFFAGEQDASVRLVIAGDNINIISDYISMVAKSTAQPNNEIWYTTVDGEIITPNATEVFGANIVSNIYKSDKGIITFDNDVTAIGQDAFRNCSDLTSISIPKNTTSIGASAFNLCTSLTNIDIPESVAGIGSGAFNECSSLTEIVIPNSVKIIDSFTFSHCNSLTNIIIPESVTEIATGAFADCSSLTSVTIPNSVAAIASDTFDGCNNLKAFHGKLASADMRCLIIDGVLNSFASAELTSYTIPENVTEIGNSVFSDCKDLTKVTIPEGVTKIGNSAFRYCIGLTDITIPESITEIGDQAFYDCNNLKSVYCKPATPPTLSLTSEAFGGNATDRKIYVPATSISAYKSSDAWKEYTDAFVKYDFKTNTIVPESTAPASNEIWYTSIDGKIVTPNATDVFDEAEIVSNTYNFDKGVITFNKNITVIGEFAFDNCSSLTSVTIPKSVKTIGTSAFSDCTNLTDITIPNSVTTIGSSAFSDCNSLTHITIPSSVKEIGYRVFFYCKNLTDVTISNGVSTIGESAFASCSSLTTIEIPESVITIGNAAFSSCRNLSSITIPQNVATIGDAAFSNCSQLTSITIPNSVATIGVRTFQGCSNLKAFYGKFASNDNLALIVNNVLKAFALNCDATSYTIPDNVTEIESYVFSRCSNLKSVTIPEGVTTINDDAFNNCSSLTSISIPNSVTEIKSYVFYGCSNLTSVIIPATITSIGNSAFATCSSLTSITIPSNITKIGYAAFSGCSNLAIINCQPTTPPTGNSFMFADISASAKIYVPINSGATYKTASHWKEYADIIEEKEM